MKRLILLFFILFFCFSIGTPVHDALSNTERKLIALKEAISDGKELIETIKIYHSAIQELEQAKKSGELTSYLVEKAGFSDIYELKKEIKDLDDLSDRIDSLLGVISTAQKYFKLANEVKKHLETKGWNFKNLGEAIYLHSPAVNSLIDKIINPAESLLNNLEILTYWERNFAEIFEKMKDNLRKSSNKDLQKAIDNYLDIPIVIEEDKNKKYDSKRNRILARYESVYKKIEAKQKKTEKKLNDASIRFYSYSDKLYDDIYQALSKLNILIYRIRQFVYNKYLFEKWEEYQKTKDDKIKEDLDKTGKMNQDFINIHNLKKEELEKRINKAQKVMSDLNEVNKAISQEIDRLIADYNNFIDRVETLSSGIDFDYFEMIKKRTNK